ncbi:MAG: hypothetical protein LH647_22805 [Leptolyngbyaceae cyanobacterium CAN_BIN12]|nr:hypothetical protein [Leptolyngbyaceae cyanobacterium CAN_BIN12]
MSEAPPQTTEEKDEKAPWNTKLADIIIKVLAGGSIGTFATLLSSSDLPKLALGAFFGGVVAPIVFAITEPISKKCASQKPF